MTDDALKHWAHVGAPGDTPADGWVPSGLNEFTQPASGVWKFDFDAAQTAVLLAGHRAMEMEDKWHVVRLPSTSNDRVSIEFVRSWTGNPVVRLDLLLTSFGSRVEKAIWEMDPELVKGASEEFAKGQFIEVARDVLRMPLAPVQLIIHRGDITQIKVDAIVNAANSTLLGGGGVDGAIHRAGGPAILEACRALRASTLPDGLPAGKAVATTAGDLHATWVIHTVGPVWSATEDRSETLASCYREALRVADEQGADVVAFPAISAGVYGWPIADAARIAVETVRAAETSVSRIVFALPGEAAIEAFTAAIDS